MAKQNLISAAIVTYNGGQTALAAVKSIIQCTIKYPVNFYVFDNASSDETTELIANLNSVVVIKNGKNLGFGAGHNKIMHHEMGKYHFIINPDITINSDVLSSIADFMEQNPDIVMCMPKILGEDGTEQKLPKEKPTFKKLFLGRLAFLGGPFAKIRSDYVWENKEITDITDVDFCTGCFFCIRSEIFKKLGGFDERFFMYLEDADLTIRAKKYGRTVMNPNISVTHKWERESTRSIKYLLIHISSAIKFLIKK